ncbi:lysoplasmalogenase [Celeribacter persicus]|uniref:Putative membrane protein YhhN n=1 Tax=Celeribacter persicus TaxID=1651082 RepID=A0A2T5HM50_9RHOB|nr:lysoplasmalogenase [Celeribacter persicus]PTQ72626.1 putative membrane protein YhhN [Celeribacter persicus]
MEIMLWGIAGVAAVAYLPLTARPPARWRSGIKTLPVAVFALIGGLSGAPLLLIAGLALSAFGDWALSRPGERAFLIGLIGFALGHLCYFVLFAGLEHLAFWTVLPFVVLALSTELWLAPHTGGLKIPVRIYVLLICAMAVAAVNLPHTLRLASVGAVAFVLSDLILAIQMFRLDKAGALSRGAGYALWVLYVVAQALILAAFVL